MPQQLMFIGGEWVKAESGESYSVINPATAVLLTDVAKGRGEDVSRAVDAARSAFNWGPWPRMAPGEEALALHGLRGQVLARGARGSPLRRVGKSLNDF